MFCLFCPTMMKQLVITALTATLSNLACAAALTMTPAILPAGTPAAIPVLDAPASQDVLTNYRHTGDLEKIPPNLDRAGMVSLHMHGSAEFTPLAFAQWRKTIAGPVTVFDLRQEAHGFINGQAVTWYAERDWGQAGMTHHGAIVHEAELLVALPGQKDFALWDAKALKSGAAGTPEHIAISEARSEANVVETNHARYARLTVTDHVRPTDEEVERFLDAVHKLPADGEVLFHCRAGQGRTTTFMVMYDMLRNAAHVPMQTIIAREAALGRDYDLNKLPAPDDWKYPYQQDRAAFIHAFYEYAAANPDGKPGGWTQWLARESAQPTATRTPTP